MSGTIQQPQPDSTDNLAVAIVREKWAAIEQRNQAERDLEESTDPELALVRTVARAARRGLRISVPVEGGKSMSQPLPFEPLGHAPGDYWFSEPLPEYVDWGTFVYANGPGRGFADWLAKLLRPCGDVIPVIGPGAPVIPECAQPPLPPWRALRRQEIERRMSEFPVVARKPGRQAPWEGKPMREMVVAFAHDIYGMTDLDAAQALELNDYCMRVEKTGACLVDVDGGSRGGRRHVRAGRARLSRLGAWPWCLAPNGRPPPNWYVKQKYAEALAGWHYPQWLAAYVANEEAHAALFDSVGAAALHPSVLRIPSKQRPMEAARAAYRGWYCDRCA